MGARKAAGAGWILRGLAMLAAWAVLIAGLVFVWPAWRRAAEDPPYAAQVFDGLIPYDRVLASRRWNPPGLSGWGCSYAVVALGPAAPEVPGRRDPGAAGWEFAWGGDWQPTPAAPLGDTTRDAVDACTPHFDPDTAARLAVALSEPGSWYVRDAVGETVHIHSVPQGVAARIRYGD
jgi:hypothetical protein